jgi:hypothetical protein
MTRLINADALITAVLKNAIDYAVVFGDSEMHRLLVQVIAHQPTIDAEPVRHGKWVFNPSDALEAMFAKPKCSECGFESADGGNYCPNCGARMDEE